MKNPSKGDKKVQLDNEISINNLVSDFYSKVREDDLIGPVFNSQIDNWNEHLSRITDFWLTNLLFQPKFKGNPMLTHIQVDKKANHEINQLHFARWLALWFSTIDKNYEGKNAELAKQRARKMSTHLFIKMAMARKSK